MQAMRNIPYDAIKNSRRFEDHAHATMHVILYMCHSRGVSFDFGSKNQIGIPVCQKLKNLCLTPTPKTSCGFLVVMIFWSDAYDEY